MMPALVLGCVAHIRTVHGGATIRRLLRPDGWTPLASTSPSEQPNSSGRLRMLWRVQSIRGRVWEAARYRIESGLELRLQPEGKEDALPAMPHLFRAAGAELEDQRAVARGAGREGVS